MTPYDTLRAVAQRTPDTFFVPLNAEDSDPADELRPDAWVRFYAEGVEHYPNVPDDRRNTSRNFEGVTEYGAWARIVETLRMGKHVALVLRTQTRRLDKDETPASTDWDPHVHLSADGTEGRLVSYAKYKQVTP